MGRENPPRGTRQEPVYEEEGARDRASPQEVFEIMIPALQIGGLAGKKHPIYLSQKTFPWDNPVCQVFLCGVLISCHFSSRERK